MRSGRLTISGRIAPLVGGTPETLARARSLRLASAGPTRELRRAGAAPRTRPA